MTIEVGGASGGLPKLDLDPNLGQGFTANNIDATSGLTEIFNLSGKYSFNYLKLIGASAGLYPILLIIDGEPVWDGDLDNPGTNTTILGADRGSTPYEVASSLVFSIQSPSDNDINLVMQATPIK